MKTALDELLEKLSAGDPDAVDEAFRRYEPYLRKVVHRLLPLHLRPKFDSCDIVQSAWSDLLKGFCDAGWKFASANQLRAFLVRVTHNRFLDRLRKQEKIVRREVHLGDEAAARLPAPGPTPSACARADDLWQHMLEQCPPEQRHVLILKREGLTPQEIADRTGLHPGSVRRVLRQLAGRLLNESTTTS